MTLSLGRMLIWNTMSWLVFKAGVFMKFIEHLIMNEYDSLKKSFQCDFTSLTCHFHGLCLWFSPSDLASILQEFAQGKVWMDCKLELLPFLISKTQFKLFCLAIRLKLRLKTKIHWSVAYLIMSHAKYFEVVSLIKLCLYCTVIKLWKSMSITLNNDVISIDFG